MRRPVPGPSILAIAVTRLTEPRRHTRPDTGTLRRQEATEAAEELAMSDDFARVIAKAAGISSPEKLPHFQVLLKAASMAGAPEKVDVIAWRN